MKVNLEEVHTVDGRHWIATEDENSLIYVFGDDEHGWKYRVFHCDQRRECGLSGAYATAEEAVQAAQGCMAR